MRQHTSLLLAASLTLIALSAEAADVSFSGFGTVGYARSDQSYAYQRYIDDDGAFARDSVLGVQMDAQFTPQWGATLQAKLAPADDNDDRWEPTLSWAFLSWRPNDDWLLRFGKLRIPGYLNSESLDVGVTYDYARLPIEMYSLSPTLDFTGASFNKTWELDSGDLSLDGYWGVTDTQFRKYMRDGIPGLLPAGQVYEPIRIESRGLVLTYRGNGDIYHLGLHQATAERTDDQLWPDRPVLSGAGYYDFVGVPSRSKIVFPIVSLGADIGLGGKVRLAAEYARRQATDVDGGINSSGSYISLLKPIGKWTPYVYYARLRSDGEMLDLYRAVNGTTTGIPIIDAMQRAGADGILVYDQQTWAIGTSYALSPTGKIKAEWQRTRIGLASSLVDAPAGSNVSNQDINVFSLSYSFVF